MKEIEKVSRGAPIGITTPFRKRRVTYLISIQYRDGTDKTVWLESRCVGFVRNGFLSKKKRDWLFYDAEGELVATRPAKEIGQCAKIGMGEGQDEAFYFFAKPDGSPLALDAKGKELGLSSMFVGALHAWFFREGITPVADGMRRALDVLRVSGGNPAEEHPPTGGSGE